MKQVFEKWFCKHKWKLVKEITYTYEGTKSGLHQLYYCEICGKFKKIKF